MDIDSPRYYRMILSKIDFIINIMVSVLSDASHGKLLLQAEEAINTRLNDAQKRIKTVQKVTSLTI